LSHQEQLPTDHCSMSSHIAYCIVWWRQAIYDATDVY